MAKKKKAKRRGPQRPPQAAQPETTGAAAPARPKPTSRGKKSPAKPVNVSPASAARRDRKDEARRHREAALRRYRRQQRIRRLGILAVVALLVAGFFAYQAIRSSETNRLLAESRQIAAEADCTEINEPGVSGEIQGQLHGPPFDYRIQPAVFGRHEESTLSPDVRVYREPVNEPLAVHNLEHGYVIVYYRQAPDETAGVPTPAPTASGAAAAASLADGEDAVAQAAVAQASPTPKASPTGKKSPKPSPKPTKATPSPSESPSTPPTETPSAAPTETGAPTPIPTEAGPLSPLPDDVVKMLEDLARSETKVIVAPYPNLDPGQAFALAAWNRLQQCPADVSSADAKRLAEIFIELYRGGGDAPEANGV